MAMINCKECNADVSDGAAIGGTIGTGMLMGVWIFGDIILGMFVLFTRPKEK